MYIEYKDNNLQKGFVSTYCIALKCREKNYVDLTTIDGDTKHRHV